MSYRKTDSDTNIDISNSEVVFDTSKPKSNLFSRAKTRLYSLNELNEYKQILLKNRYLDDIPGTTKYSYTNTFTNTTESHKMIDIANNMRNGKWTPHKERQRTFVWQKKKQVLFISSLLQTCFGESNAPIPPIWISKTGIDSFNIDDGHQRCETIKRFVYGDKNGKKLKLGYEESKRILSIFLPYFLSVRDIKTNKILSKFKNDENFTMGFDDLPEYLQKAFEQVRIYVIILTTKKIMFDLMDGELNNVPLSSDSADKESVWDWFVNVQLGNQKMDQHDVLAATSGILSRKLLPECNKMSEFLEQNKYESGYRKIYQGLLEALFSFIKKDNNNSLVEFGKAASLTNWIDQNRDLGKYSDEVFKYIDAFKQNVMPFIYDYRLETQKLSINKTEIKIFFALLFFGWDKIFSNSNDFFYTDMDQNKKPKDLFFDLLKFMKYTSKITKNTFEMNKKGETELIIDDTIYPESFAKLVKENMDDFKNLSILRAGGHNRETVQKCTVTVIEKIINYLILN